ncbi:hypothetical protein EAH_00033440 [Eimeria acervulina]|uniref:Uncharacterized protein n=1 Tax=Eimeria acervulina TaxID=5801 RepID=U6GIL2_EIMAC|nr:hypothetical protein EAH_00033440 [Eimeria acervulina]CDI78429.1 hypothetical protein EAH_00033440 [Eimeria acervulina]
MLINLHGTAVAPPPAAATAAAAAATAAAAAAATLLLHKLSCSGAAAQQLFSRSTLLEKVALGPHTSSWSAASSSTCSAQQRGALHTPFGAATGVGPRGAPKGGLRGALRGAPKGGLRVALRGAPKGGPKGAPRGAPTTVWEQKVATVTVQTTRRLQVAQRTAAGMGGPLGAPKVLRRGPRGLEAFKRMHRLQQQEKQQQEKQQQQQGLSLAL